MLFPKNHNTPFNSNLILFIFFLSCFIGTVKCQNNYNDSYLGSYIREFPPNPFYPNGEGKMLKTPAGSSVKCTDPLPPETYPLPRCISNQFAYNLSPYDVEQQSELRSNRRTSHMATWFGQYISFDITSSRNTNPSTPLSIPADDAAFNPPNSIPGELSAKGIMSLPFNLSQTSSDTPDPFNTARSGINTVTPFLDLNTIYGTSDDQLATLRDGTSCKLLTSNNGKYPSRDTDGSYKWGIHAKRSWSLFTLAINTVWIREHNRLCDERFKEHGYSWTDQQYFDESKRWNVAFFQKATSEEYLGTILGRPLPDYKGYDPNLVPGIDTFFSTVALRYGHTELSDVFRIQDEYGDTIADLTLNQIKDQSLVETFGLDRVLSSMAQQRQENVDIFFSDATRNVISPEPVTYDLPAFDISRSRDHGISLYNVVREAYGLPRKNTWDEITKSKYIQDRLQLLYPNGPDMAEAYVGAFCEDRLDGSNFGELLNASIVTQFDRIRKTDRYWWESSERFNDAEKIILRNTTFQTIIARNLEIDGVDGSQFVKSIWTVQPHSQLQGGDDAEYPNKISSWTSYSIKYRLDNTQIYFKVELQTVGGEGWFGMGFDPSDEGMRDAEFIIGIIKNNDIELSNYHADVGGYHPPVRESPEGLKIKSKGITSGGVATIEFSRLLAPPNRKPIRHGQMKYIMAYNPTSSGFSYHGPGNRELTRIDFYTNQISASDVSGYQRDMRFYHGIGMFLTWCLLFPISIFIVRFRKHTNNYLKIHRIIQVLGGISVSTFGAAAIATVTANRSPHAWLGLIIYTFVFVELGLGLLSIWGLAAVVSVNQGYPRVMKRIHKFFGAILLLTSLVNIYLGIDTYTLFYSIEPKYWKISYAIWTFILIIIFIFGEYHRRRKGSYYKLYHNIDEESDLDKRKLVYSDYDKLPEFTWEEINERVQSGAFLVVCDGFVVDIRRWIGVHPGGAKILEKVIGTDITQDFHNTHKEMNIVEDVETPETQLLSAYKDDSIGASSLEKYDGILGENPSYQRFGVKIQNVAKIVDKINAKYFSNSPLAIHEHSALATKKMLEMVVGKMNEISFVEQVPLPTSPTFDTRRMESKYFFGDEESTQRIKFRRYKLTSRSTVNSNKNYPVVKFTFTKVYQDEKDVWDEGFLPGYYIEVQSYVEGQIVVRSYTPIEGKLSKSFSIYVKVYSNGLMSTHLYEQLIGFEIKARGPFDVSDRFKLSASSQGEMRRMSLLSSPTKSKSSLINPNNLDGCWEELFMICGGTGITPMLQLIKYNLFHTKRSNRKINMYLLYGNRGVEDVIDGKRLREYESSSGGMLKVSFVFSDPPLVEWKGLHGRITRDVIQKWLSDIKAKAQTILPTSQEQPASPISTEYQQQSTSASASRNLSSSPTHYGDNISAQSKIIACGPMDVIINVEQTLIEMGYAERDYILIK